MGQHDFSRCVDRRRCFAKDKNTSGYMFCKILTKPRADVMTFAPAGANYNDGECPFCKGERSITDGVKYR